MLPFRVHQLRIGSLDYLLLPKMTKAQMNLVSERLTGAGYSVVLSGSLSARSARARVHVAPSGVCRSTDDISDLIIPAIPELLAYEKERIPIRRLISLYLTTGRSGSKTLVRINTRTESWLPWDLMRASDLCGLSPDEHAVSTFILDHAEGACEVLTDFPEEGSEVRVVGRRLYFDSKVSPAMAALTLRVAGAKSSKNSYLRRDGMLKFADLEGPSSAGWSDFFDGLGEWCYFAPA